MAQRRDRSSNQQSGAARSQTSDSMPKARKARADNHLPRTQMAQAVLASPETVRKTKRRRSAGLPTLMWLLLVVLAALGGWFVGFVLMGGVGSHAAYGTLTQKAALSESELDEVVGSYTLEGKRYDITAREALEQESSIDAARNQDGTYAMPSAEEVLAAARTAVLQREIDKRGITVSDEEVLAYAQAQFGTSDLAALAGSYAMDEATVKARMSESAAMAKLRDQVIGVGASVPQPPIEPQEGAAENPTEEYAAYVIALAGSEWDSERDAWASTEGPLASALKDFEISSQGATYEAARTAYNVAFQAYNDRMTVAGTEWSAFVNELLCQAKVAISSLVA